MPSLLNRKNVTLVSICATSFLIILAIYFSNYISLFSNNANTASVSTTLTSIQKNPWAEKVGLGIIAPACGSSSGTCNGNPIPAGCTCNTTFSGSGCNGSNGQCLATETLSCPNSGGSGGGSGSNVSASAGASCPASGGSADVSVNFQYTGNKTCKSGSVLIHDPASNTDVASYTTLNCGAESHTFNNLQINHNYEYDVQYYNATAPSDASRIAEDFGPISTGNCAAATMPTGLKATCPVGGGVGTISWNTVAGAKYMLRADYTANPWVGDCSKAQNAGDVCKDNLNTTSYNTTFVSGGTYDIWVHSINSAGVWSNAASINFTCGAAAPSGNNAPTVNITAPNDCSVVTAGVNTNITATASDSDGSVANVKFEYRTGAYRKIGAMCTLSGATGWTTISTDATSPYASVLANTPPGGVEVRATATDNKGATGQDSVVVNSLGAGTTPQCSDSADNDGDGKIDAADPQCHTDGNASNPGSYNPSDDDESGGSSCAANAGQPCSATNNICVPPENNSGTYDCAGICNATAPSNNQCSLPDISCGSIPGGSCSKLINQGNSCLIEWNATNATTCSVSGPGLNQTGLPTTGSVQTPILQVTSLYTITCYNGPAVFSSRTFTCRINPKEQEI